LLVAKKSLGQPLANFLGRLSTGPATAATPAGSEKISRRLPEKPPEVPSEMGGIAETEVGHSAGQQRTIRQAMRSAQEPQGVEPRAYGGTRASPKKDLQSAKRDTKPVGQYRGLERRVFG
jgi:hypothetical protein